MRIRVLGGISVVDGDSRRVAIRSPRPKMILALLASRHGAVVSEDALMEAIWAEMPPLSARTALQTYVSALRDELEPDRPRRSPGRFIAHEGDGYVLRLEEDDELDVAELEQRVEHARRIYLDDRSAAIELLDRALSLWSDPPFGEFVDAPWAIAETTRLRTLHASAYEARFGLALDDGSEASVIDLMAEAVRVYPYRERLAGQHMLALYRRGEQQRALGQYASTRERLLDDLGLDPGRELQLLERAILAQDPALRTRGRESQPADTVRATQVPSPRPLVGREDELREVVELLGHERCLSVVGPGGVGKSALVANAVHEVATRYDGRIHHVDLAEVGGRGVLRSIAAAVRMVEHPLAPLADSLTDAIGDDPTLLVVETCEVAIDEIGAAVSALLAAPGLQVLVTSQSPLGLQPERVVRLGPLKRDAAIAVLTRSRRVKDADRTTLQAIADRVDRLPLGLELAAARVEQLGVDDLLASLDTSPSLLVGAADRPERHRSVTAAVEWGLGLLEPELRSTLGRLSAFAAPFTLVAARALNGDGEAIDAAVAELADRSLVERIAGSPTRFRLPDPIRVVVEANEKPDDVAATRTRLAEITLEAAGAQVFGIEAPADLDHLDSEVVPALLRFAELEDPRQLTLAGLLGMYFIERGRISEGREQLAQALRAHPGASESLRLMTSSQLGFLTWYQGDLTATRRVMRHVVGLIDHAPNDEFRRVIAGVMAFVEHRFDDAAAEMCAAADASTGETKQRLLILHMTGNCCWYAGDLGEARARYRQQREIARDLDDRFQLAQALRFEAMVAAQTGDIESAWRCSERSLVMARDMADSVSLAQSCAASAVVASIVGVDEDATTHAVDAIRASHRHFDVFAFRTTLPIVADAGVRHGEATRAARLLGWYLDLLDRTGQTPFPATGHLDDVVDRVRDELGPVEFARAGAQGAASRLGDIVADAAAVDRLVRTGA